MLFQLVFELQCECFVRNAFGAKIYFIFLKDSLVRKRKKSFIRENLKKCDVSAKIREYRENER